jgi:PD-(D/E)XK nuclease superfamily protein
MNDSDDIRGVLEQLVLDNPELERLEAIIDTFNPFVAMRWTRQEVKHSTFLAWLLNPRETHRLGSYCLRTFLKRVARYSQNSDSPSVIDLDSWDLDGATVSVEWRGIDVFVQDDVNRFVAVFENKIDSGEHSDQLRRYRTDVIGHFPEHKKLFSYLTIEGDPATDEGYIPIGYSEVAQFIRDTLARRGEQIGPEVRSFLEQYAEMIRRHIVEDSEVQQLCRAIYSKHQKALDLIWEHRPDRAAMVSDTLQEIVANESNLLRDHCSKSYVRFIPGSWDVLPRAADGWTPTKRMLLFEFDISKGGIFLKLVLGPGDQAVRQLLQSAVVENPSVFNKAGSKVYPRWWSCHTEKWMSASQVEDAEPTELKTTLTQRFQQFVVERLPAMQSAVDSAIQAFPNLRTVGEPS